MQGGSLVRGGWHSHSAGRPQKGRANLQKARLFGKRKILAWFGGRGFELNGPKIPLTMPITRIATLRFLETGYACGVTLASKVALLAHNRLNFSR